MSSNILDFQIMDARESDVRSSLNSLIDSLQTYKNELTRQERKLQDARNLQLDQLTDSNSASIIRNLNRKINEKETELGQSQQKCIELEEQVRIEQSETKSKSRHIEKLSVLLLSKEERIQELEKKNKESEGRVGTLEVLMETRDGACEKWKNAAQEAAEKMREQLNTLKSSEEMNKELKLLLDNQIAKNSDDITNVTDSSDVISQAVHQFVTSFSTPQTTAVTSSVVRKPSILNRIPSYKTTPISSSMSSTPNSKTMISTKSLPSLYGGTVTSPATPQLKVIRVTRAASPSVDGTSQVIEEIIEEPYPVQEVIVRTVEPDDTINMKHERDESIVSTPHTPRVRFQDDTLEHIIRTSPGKFALLPYPAPVPKFSPLVGNALESERIHDPVLWKYFIRECVHFYYDLLPTTDSQARNSYFNIGRTLHEKYPFIAKEGPNFKTPWTYFNTCLSSRLRNERFTKRRQSENRGYILPAEDAPEAKRGRMDDDSSLSWREGCHL